MDERVFWIWLQHAFGEGSPRPVKLASQYPGGAEEFCLGGPKLWNSRRDLTDREAAAMQDFSLAQAEAQLEYTEKMKWRVLVPGGEGYPRLLGNIPNPPAVLYVKGNLPDVDSMLSISVVGSRKAGPEMEDVARKFGYQLAAGGACVVSGGAVGVDSAALVGAMGIPDSHLISVLPVSLNSSYLAKNAKLRRIISSGRGALVSEHCFLDSPTYGTFPVRNRLITGLSRGVVLIQAARKSGTLIYASHALDQDRDVFVYPGPEGLADSVEFAGSKGLLADGAKPVFCGEDVLAEYGGQPLEKPELRFADLLDDIAIRVSKDAAPAPAAARAPRRKKAEALEDPGGKLSLQARQVLDALGEEPLSVQQLEKASGLPAASLLAILTELEVEGLALSLPGKRYLRRS